MSILCKELAKIDTTKMMFLSVLKKRLYSQPYLLRVHLLLRAAHGLGRLSHHGGHPLSGVVGLDLGDRQLSHVGGLVHLLGDGLLRKEDACLLGSLVRLAFLQELYHHLPRIC